MVNHAGASCAVGVQDLTLQALSAAAEPLSAPHRRPANDPSADPHRKGGGDQRMAGAVQRDRQADSEQTDSAIGWDARPTPRSILPNGFRLRNGTSTAGHAWPSLGLGLPGSTILANNFR